MKRRTKLITRWSSHTDALYAYRTTYPDVISSLDTRQTDHSDDDKASLYLNAIFEI